jgi:hypothetical protein
VGALLALHRAVGCLGLRLVPYCLLALVPLLGRVSDPHPLARALAARCLAAVVALMPLAQGAGEPPGLDAGQRAVLEGEGRALLALLDNRGMEDYQLPVRWVVWVGVGGEGGGGNIALLGARVAGGGCPHPPFRLSPPCAPPPPGLSARLNGPLRRYQQEGLNWLAFLRRYGLHGVLADDMGLGKTLQVLALLAAHAHEAAAAHAASGDQRRRPLPSLVVCPATLVAHWPHEAERWVGPALRVLQYQGTPAERAALRPALPRHDVLVLSYDSLRAGEQPQPRRAAGLRGPGRPSSPGRAVCPLPPPRFPSRRGLGVLPGLVLLRAGRGPRHPQPRLQGGAGSQARGAGGGAPPAAVGHASAEQRGGAVEPVRLPHARPAGQPAPVPRALRTPGAGVGVVAAAGRGEGQL